MARKIVLKIGGSLLFDDNLTFREDMLREFAEILKKSENVIAVVVGGGRLARTYISAARTLGSGEAICDLFGIRVSRLNAFLLINALGDKSFPEPITKIEDALVNRLWDKILVAGGFIPGQSTTSVTFEIAEALNVTDVVILTNVDGIYNKDPNKNPDAKKFDNISIEQLEEVIYGGNSASQSAAGEYRIFDAVSFQILKRSKLSVRLINGEKMSVVEDLLIKDGFKTNIGTVIEKNS